MHDSGASHGVQVAAIDRHGVLYLLDQNPSRVLKLNPRTGKQIYPGYPPGHEAIAGSWQPWIIASPQERSIQIMFGNSFYGQAVFEDPHWDFRTLNFDSDVALAAEKAGAVLNSTNPDLRSFRAPVEG